MTTYVFNWAKTIPAGKQNANFDDKNEILYFF